MSEKPAKPAAPPEVQLRRTLSLPLLTFYGVGTILGAGIYVLVGKVAGSAGMYAPVAFVISTVLAAFSAFSYAEMSARYPESAGEAVYIREGLGNARLAVGVGLMIAGVGIVSNATLANGVVGYVQVFVDLPEWLVISVFVLGLGALAAWGIAESAVAASLITVIEVAGLLLVIWVGRENLAGLPHRLPELLPPADGGIWLGILAGAFIAFYAFIGFEDMVNVAEEVKDPSRTLPAAILLALVVTALLYITVAVVAVLSIPPARLGASDAPLAMVYETTTGRSPAVIGVISILALLNGALIQVIMASRVLYGMSRRGWLPAGLGDVSPVTRTPLKATVLVVSCVLALALWLPLVALAKITSLITLSVFALVNLALWRAKRRVPAPPGVRVYPLWIPALGFAVTAGFVVFQIGYALLG
jgi:APA family basic amino acid/polyamine antiporter